MKHLRLIGMFLLMGIASNAVAVTCSDQGYTALNNAQANAALSGKRVLAVAPDEQWNEDHCADGALFKVGDGSPVDPRAFRGTWTVQPGPPPVSVTYDYTVGGSSNYTWELWGNNGSLCWEGGGAIIATAPAPGSAGTPCNLP